MKTNSDKPAFPVDGVYAADSFRGDDAGLTMREYFAAMAMQGVLAGHYDYFTGNSDVSVPSEIAKYAVFNADALINEFNKEVK